MKQKPSRTFSKGTTETTKRVSLNIDTILTQSYNIQENIDTYNLDIINNYKEDFFSDLSLNGNSVIVRPFKENFIKEYIEETKTASAIGFKMIDNRKRKTDQESYIPSPLTYINAGILIAAPKEYLEANNMQIGDVLMLRKIQWVNHMFYPNRQENIRDYVESPDNWSIVFFEGYFNISQYDIEGSIKNEVFKEKYMNTVLSPIYNKTTLEDLIKHHTLLEERIAKEREEYMQSVNSVHIGEEINIKSL